MEIEGFFCKNQKISIPKIILGTYQITNSEQMETVLRTILENDYIKIGLDTATIYKNEEIIGKALQKLEIPRERIFLLSKVWDDKGGDYARVSLEESLRLLQTDYLDLFLLHWPCKNRFVESWATMEQIYKSGKVRAVGVSNFMEKHLQQLKDASSLCPAINQIEHHPYFTRNNLVEACHKQGIVPQAWSPFMRGGDVLQDPVIQQVAEQHGKKPAQVIIRWNLQLGVSVAAMSTSPERIRQNADVFNFALSPEDVAQISALNRDAETGTNPDSVDW